MYKFLASLIPKQDLKNQIFDQQKASSSANPLGVPWDVWFCIFQFCGTSQKIIPIMIRVNKSFFAAIMQHHKEYQLQFCINAAYFCKKLQHYLLPAQSFVQEQVHKLQVQHVKEPISQQEYHEAQQEEQVYTYAVLNDSIAVAPKFFTEAAAQSLLVLLMKYLAWNPTELKKHPFSQVNNMVKIGIQLYKEFSKASTNDAVTRAKKIVANIEDYANCIVAGTNESTFVTLGVLLYNEANAISNEQLLLTFLRAGKVMSGQKYATKNEECIAFLMNGPTGHEMIDVQVFQSSEFIKQAISKYPQIFCYAPDAVKHNESILQQAISIGKPQIVFYTSVKLQQKYKQHFIQAITSPENYRNVTTTQQINPAWIDDAQVMHAFVSVNGTFYSQASSRLQALESFALFAVQQNWYTYQTIQIPSLKQNLNILRCVLQNNLGNFSIFIKSDIEMHPELRQVEQVVDEYELALRSSKYHFTLEEYVQKNNIKLDIFK